MPSKFAGARADGQTLVLDTDGCGTFTSVQTPVNGSMLTVTAKSSNANTYQYKLEGIDSVSGTPQPYNEGHAIRIAVETTNNVPLNTLQLWP